MVGQSTQQRAGLAISPLVIVAAIFCGLVLIEGLLVARFWIQLATSNASNGLQGLILDLSRPLVAPFSDAGATAQNSVGSFERKTLVAAMVYLVSAVALAVVTMVAGGLLGSRQRLSTRRRRNQLQQIDHPLAEHAGARLIGTASLAMSPSRAARALRMLHLDRYEADLYVIPAQGGCIVAAFASRGALARRLTSGQEARSVRQALRNIERRFQAESPRASDLG